jgi:hypothetical protein
MTVSARGLTQRTTALQSIAGADRRSRIRMALRRHPRLFIGGSLVAVRAVCGRVRATAHAV